MECKNPKPLSRRQKDIETMKEDLMGEIDMAAWDIGDRMREMRIAIGMLIADQSDHGRLV